MKTMFNQTGMDIQYKVWHKNYEYMIMYVHSGSGSIVTTEKNHLLNKGCLYFIGADKFHYTLPNEPKNYVRSKMFIRKKQLDQILSVFPEEMYADKLFTSDALLCTQLPQEEQDKISLFFQDAKQHLNNDAVLSSLYMRLLGYITDCTDCDLSVQPSEIQTAVEYIHHHITKDIKIDDICRAVNLSKYYFCRKFKRNIGCTVMEYIVRTRVIMAQTLLKDKSLSVTEISEKCGFSCVSYFCRIFKERTDKTPLQYRKEINI